MDRAVLCNLVEDFSVGMDEICASHLQFAEDTIFLGFK